LISNKKETELLLFTDIINLMVILFVKKLLVLGVNFLVVLVFMKMISMVTSLWLWKITEVPFLTLLLTKELDGTNIVKKIKSLISDGLLDMLDLGLIKLKSMLPLLL